MYRSGPMLALPITSMQVSVPPNMTEKHTSDGKVLLPVPPSLLHKSLVRSLFLLRPIAAHRCKRDFKMSSPQIENDYES